MLADTPPASDARWVDEEVQMVRILAALAAFLLLPTLPGAAIPPTAPAVPGAPPPAAAGPFCIFVERVIQNASLTLDFAPEGSESAAAEGRQTLYLYLGVEAADRDRLLGIVGLGRNLSATTDAGQNV